MTNPECPRCGKEKCPKSDHLHGGNGMGLCHGFCQPSPTSSSATFTHTCDGKNTVAYINGEAFDVNEDGTIGKPLPAFNLPSPTVRAEEWEAELKSHLILRGVQEDDHAWFVDLIKNLLAENTKEVRKETLVAFEKACGDCYHYDEELKKFLKALDALDEEV